MNVNRVAVSWGSGAEALVLQETLEASWILALAHPVVASRTFALPRSTGGPPEELGGET